MTLTLIPLKQVTTGAVMSGFGAGSNAGAFFSAAGSVFSVRTARLKAGVKAGMRKIFS